jgi:hypothetical protein
MGSSREILFSIVAYFLRLNIGGTFSKALLPKKKEKKCNPNKV